MFWIYLGLMAIAAGGYAGFSLWRRNFDPATLGKIAAGTLLAVFFLRVIGPVEGCTRTAICAAERSIADASGQVASCNQPQQATP